LGGGVAGLAAARALLRAGVDDCHLLELEDAAGGNARGYTLGSRACPLGAHYLPVPGESAHELRALLEELGLMRFEYGRWVADERHLCHSPQERLFYEGAWHEGLLPPAEPGSARLAQYRRFADLVAAAQRELGFALPSHRAPWTAGHAALDAQPFATWLDAQGLSDPALRWYLDYACRDDYGADARGVSAWAGLHYFGSRHGFHAPGDDAPEREPVFTWPEGNAWLTTRLAQPLGPERLHTGQTVLRVESGQHAVQALVWDEAAQAARLWLAPLAVLALPLHVAARVWPDAPAALMQAARDTPQAPWLVANLQLRAPLLARVGTEPAWDNVAYGSAGLGYVDASHQALRPDLPRTLLTAYLALPTSRRGELLAARPEQAARWILADLAALHPDLPAQLERIDLMRYGHAMAIPAPGVRGSPARAALRNLPGRIRLAHADLAGYSVFEEAYNAGIEDKTMG
ncbi:MAG TPA: FAD-dependent oxidoreductase, partial [Burkholderiaceae bacterium]|nr:FAD-dependent oxidoreductase [Burkholderiaceae bacterium]